MLMLTVVAAAVAAAAAVVVVAMAAAVLDIYTHTVYFFIVRAQCLDFQLSDKSGIE